MQEPFEGNSAPGAQPPDPERDAVSSSDQLRTGAARWLLLGTGFFFVGLAALGVVLPVLPTTPFLLIAAACFARSSPRFYNWLLANQFFGPLIREWRSARALPRHAKFAAIGMIAVVGGSSVAFFVAHPWAKLALSALLLGLVIWLWRLPTSVPLSPDE
jgi:uncharacterized membrane protein YbaN (DUF454 family)